MHKFGEWAEDPQTDPGSMQWQCGFSLSLSIARNNGPFLPLHGCYLRPRPQHMTGHCWGRRAPRTPVSSESTSLFSGQSWGCLPLLLLSLLTKTVKLWRAFLGPYCSSEPLIYTKVPCCLKLYL